jgi:hypothetical protein
VASHAAALAEAALRRSCQPSADDASTQAGGPALASAAQDVQHEEAGQLPRGKRARTSGAFHASQPAPLQEAEHEPGVEHPPAALVKQSFIAMCKTDLLGAMQHSVARTLQNWFRALVMDVQANGAAAHGCFHEDPERRNSHLQSVSRNHSAGVKTAELADALHSCQHEVQDGERLLALQPSAMTSLGNDVEDVSYVNCCIILLAGVHLHGARQDRRPA